MTDAIRRSTIFQTQLDVPHDVLQDRGIVGSNNRQYVGKSAINVLKKDP